MASLAHIAQGVRLGVAGLGEGAKRDAPKGAAECGCSVAPCISPGYMGHARSSPPTHWPFIAAVNKRLLAVIKVWLCFVLFLGTGLWL